MSLDAVDRPAAEPDNDQVDQAKGDGRSSCPTGRSAAAHRLGALLAPLRQMVGPAAPGADGGLVTVGLDATVVIAHSEENAAPTWKKMFGPTRSARSPTMARTAQGSRWPSS